MSYWSIPRSTSDCVHFCYADDLDSSGLELREVLDKAGIVCAYIDYPEVRRQGELLQDAIGRALKLEHLPYGPGSPHRPLSWTRFGDDLAGLSFNANGGAIVIDNANDLLASDSKIMFLLIETFLTWFDHWFEKKKPCHLCFQLEPNEWVKRIFGLKKDA